MVPDEPPVFLRRTDKDGRTHDFLRQGAPRQSQKVPPDRKWQRHSVEKQEIG